MCGKARKQRQGLVQHRGLAQQRSFAQQWCHGRERGGGGASIVANQTIRGWGSHQGPLIVQQLRSQLRVQFRLMLQLI